MSEHLPFEAVREAALASCQADDVREKLQSVDLDQQVIDTVVALERSRRIGEYTAAIFTTLESHRERLTAERDLITGQISDIDELLASQPVFATVALDEDIIPQELPAELKELIAAPAVHRVAFVSTAVALGYDQNIASRTFYKLIRTHREHDVIDLNLLVEQLTADDRHDGSHPLLGITGFGPTMLDVCFSVAEAHLSALDEQAANASS